MRRLLVVCLLAAFALPAMDGVAGASSASGGTASASAKKKKCKKGYVKKRVKGKTRCVKKKKPAPPKPDPPEPPQPITDPAQIKPKMLGSLWFWTHFDQAGSGGTTDRTHVNLCGDGTVRIRRSTTTTDGQGGSFTVIIEDLASSFSVTSGTYHPGTGDLEAVVHVDSEQRRTRTASGPEHTTGNGFFDIKLALKGGSAFMDDQAATLLGDPPFCQYEG